MSDNPKDGGAVTFPQFKMLLSAVSWSDLGGFCALNHSEYRACENLRKRRLLKLWNGRRAKNWKDQFYDITETGAAAFRDGLPKHKAKLSARQPRSAS